MKSEIKVPDKFIYEMTNEECDALMDLVAKKIREENHLAGRPEILAHPTEPDQYIAKYPSGRILPFVVNE